ncbi:hypothetical protein CC79DRAFT_354228 [Sarocladium strictum]
MRSEEEASASSGQSEEPCCSTASARESCASDRAHTILTRLAIERVVAAANGSLRWLVRVCKKWKMTAKKLKLSPSCRESWARIIDSASWESQARANCSFCITGSHLCTRSCRQAVPTGVATVARAPLGRFRNPAAATVRYSVMDKERLPAALQLPRPPTE